MKSRIEVIRRVCQSKIKAFFEPEKLHQAVYSDQAEVIFRRDGRPITIIANDGGYVGREFSDEVNTLRNYVLGNRPLIGYGGCICPHFAINWGKDREPMDMHVHLTDPVANKVIVVSTAALRYQIGDISREIGSCGKSLTIHDVLAEQEYLTVHNVSMNQFIVSVGKDHISQLQEGLLVPNQLNVSDIDKSAPEVVSLPDLQNGTSLLLACIRSGSLDKAETLATKMKVERVLKEGDKNGYEKKTQQELFCFWKSANPTNDAKMPEEKHFSISMAEKKQ